MDRGFGRKIKKNHFSEVNCKRNCLEELKSLETKMFILGVHVSLCFYPVIFGFLWRSGSVLERVKMLLKETTMTIK